MAGDEDDIHRRFAEQATLIVLPLEGRPYTKSDVLKMVTERVPKESIVALKSRERSHIFEVVFRDEESKTRFQNAEAEALCKGHKPKLTNIREKIYRCKIHFLPHFVPVKVITTKLIAAGATITECTDTQEDGIFTGPWNISYTTKTPDAIPDLLEWHHDGHSGNVLINVRGRAAFCLRCEERGHIRKLCKAPYCKICREVGHEEKPNCHNKKPSYADRAAGRKSQKNPKPVIDDPEEAESAGILSAKNAPTAPTKPVTDDPEEAERAGIVSANIAPERPTTTPPKEPEVIPTPTSLLAPPRGNFVLWNLRNEKASIAKTDTAEDEENLIDRIIKRAAAQHTLTGGIMPIAASEKHDITQRGLTENLIQRGLHINAVVAAVVESTIEATERDEEYHMSARKHDIIQKYDLFGYLESEIAWARKERRPPTRRGITFDTDEDDISEGEGSLQVDETAPEASSSEAEDAAEEDEAGEEEDTTAENQPQDFQKETPKKKKSREEIQDDYFVEHVIRATWTVPALRKPESGYGLDGFHMSKKDRTTLEQRPELLEKLAERKKQRINKTGPGETWG
jgi:hypothetical protein